MNIEGEEQDRSKVDDLWKIYIRNKTGQVVPLRAIADLHIVLGPQVITRYNNYRSVTINGSPAPGGSTGAALQAMTQVSAKTLPRGYAFEWTGTAYQEVAASGQTGFILALAILFAYLFLVALYESWVIPIPVLLSVSVGVLGSFIGILVAGLSLDLYAPDRAGGADRPSGEERHPDRGVRQGTAGGRGEHPRRPPCWARAPGFAP